MYCPMIWTIDEQFRWIIHVWNWSMNIGYDLKWYRLPNRIRIHFFVCACVCFLCMHLSGVAISNVVHNFLNQCKLSENSSNKYMYFKHHKTGWPVTKLNIGLLVSSLLISNLIILYVSISIRIRTMYTCYSELGAQ